jgi:hypothetical protein
MTVRRLMLSPNLPTEVCAVQLSSSSPPKSVRRLEIHVSKTNTLLLGRIIIPM